MEKKNQFNENGEKDGVWHYKTKENEWVECFYVNGRKEGVGKAYYLKTGYSIESGVLEPKEGPQLHILKKQCFYHKNRLHGEYLEYFLDGELKIRTNYMFGKLHGGYFEYENGKILKEIYYENGILKELN